MTRDRSLSNAMEFDRVVTVHDDGTVTDGPAGVHAPELYDGFLSGAGWEFFSAGYTGQYSYRGPIMHNLADADMARELSAYFCGDLTTYVVTVTATRESITLGSASLGGVTFGDDYGDSLRYIAETARDLELDALADATATLGRLCTSAADHG